MSKLIMWNMLTVDGGAGGRSEVADRLRVWGEELLQVSLEQARTVDALLLGTHQLRADVGVLVLRNRRRRRSGQRDAEGRLFPDPEAGRMEQHAARDGQTRRRRSQG